MIEAARPRILLVTRNLPPLVGGMERLNWHMADELSRYAEVRVIGPCGSAALSPRGVSVTEVPLRPLWKFLACAHWHAMREVRRWRPDVVLAGSGLMGPAAWMAARAGNARAAAYLHGLDLTVRNFLYRALWLPTLRRLDRIVANSSATRGLCLEAGIRSGRVRIVHPGVEIPVESSDAPAAADFRARHDLGQRPLLLSVGRLSARKGLREFVAQSLPRIVAARPGTLLVIVGDAPKDALRAKAQSPQDILAAAKANGVHANVRILGTLSEADLLAAYCAADLHVFPVREILGDMEGFGMVALEAASHGVPTVAFATGGVTDAVAEGQSGCLIRPGDYGGFADAVVRMLETRAGMRESCIRFAGGFEWSRFGEQLQHALWPHGPGTE